MAKLTEKEREGFEDIMKEDMGAIKQKFMSQIKDFWAKSREEVLKKKGWDDLIREKQELKETIGKAQDRIHAIEELMASQPLKPEQITELGGSSDEYGRFKGAHFHGIPVSSQFDYEIVEFIRANIDINVPAKFIHDLGRSAMRALAMAGTFEEARAAYTEFYSLDFRKYGVDIPPKLVDVREDIENITFTQSALALPVQKQGDFKAIEKKKEDRKTLDYLG